ncbi:post-transcriptional regulator [Niallia sp. 03133]|uniref:post-transcriptional regulator n=1 Tax=Niallia sp. 03133 TaxID=3458060 RepID=UPI0040444813
MLSAHLYDHYRKEVQPALKSKLEEFHLLGYETITEDELWFYLTKKKWKKPADSGRLFILVQDILNVKIAEYMNFATIEAYRADDFFSVLSEEEKKELLK